MPTTPTMLPTMRYDPDREVVLIGPRDGASPIWSHAKPSSIGSGDEGCRRTSSHPTSHQMIELHPPGTRHLAYKRDKLDTNLLF